MKRHRRRGRSQAAHFLVHRWARRGGGRLRPRPSVSRCLSEPERWENVLLDKGLTSATSAR